MPLTVHINSFSYKKSGIPQDKTGHGGGFVFDCRFIYNPGRREEFKTLTGKDKEIIMFLDSQIEMKKFLNNVYDITDPAVENYIERDFSDLMISFGCTGGQHRSVYASEKLKEHISSKYPSVKIELHHIEIEKGLITGK
ncbi:MAG: ATP-binding protein [Ignavibacteriae bacterium]|nr:ATP-binding protein [Ignavibacteriota bacterium]